MTQTNKYYRFDGMKAVSLWRDEGWITSNGGPGVELSDLVNHVPWLYRAVDLVADRASTVPFAIVNKSGNDIDSSADYANAVGYLPQPRRLFDQLSRALTVYGYAYALKVRNTARVLNVRYLIPTSVEAVWDADGALIGYTRNLGTRKIQYTPDDIIAFWPASEQVENGPPPSSPVIAAAQAAGVLKGADDFASGYMTRGGVRVTILAVPIETHDQEKKRLQSWWRNVVMGVKNAFGAHVMNADSVKPTVIGDGLDGLINAQLTQSKREDIATALGVPQTLLFSNAANYATAVQDTLNLYNMTIMPLCEFMAECLNEQLFSRQGLRLEFRPETIDAFHEDEAQRARAYKTYIDTGMQPSVAAQICGIELPQDMEYSELDEEEEPEETTPAPPDEVIETMEQPEPVGETPAAMEAKRWERKAVRLLEQGDITPAAEFVCYSLPEAEQMRIRDGLKSCASVADIRALFAYDPIAALTNALDRAAKAVLDDRQDAG